MNEPIAETVSGARRPLKVRQKQWAIDSAAWLARRGVEPRWISIGSFIVVAAGNHFAGPMAKQQRMALMCGACVVAALCAPWRGHGMILAAVSGI